MKKCILLSLFGILVFTAALAQKNVPITNGIMVTSIGKFVIKSMPLKTLGFSDPSSKAREDQLYFIDRDNTAHPIKLKYRMIPGGSSIERIVSITDYGTFLIIGVQNNQFSVLFEDDTHGPSIPISITPSSVLF